MDINDKLVVDKIKLHATVLHVADKLQGIANSPNPSLLVVRECLRDLRSALLTVEPLPPAAE